MPELLQFLLQLSLGGLLLYASIRLVDRWNAKNKLGVALFFSFFLALASVTPVFVLALVVLLFKYYDLTVPKGMAVGVLQLTLGFGLAVLPL